MARVIELVNEIATRHHPNAVGAVGRIDVHPNSVNIIPGLTSVYRWEGAVERSQEALLLIKSGEDSWLPVQERIRELHPYELPEIIAVPIQTGQTDYLQWISSCLK